MHAKQEFWEKKLLAWETENYGDPAAPGKRPSRFGDSLRFRLGLGHRLLAPLVRGKRVLDVGCGSGRLLSLLLPEQPAFLKGIDLSSSAIEQARRRLAAPVAAGRVALEAGDIGQADLDGYDYVVGLGLLDWLSDDEIGRLLTSIRPAAFLFATSERRVSLVQFAHRAFVWLRYGYRTHGYVPRYQSVDELAALARPAGYDTLHALRHPRMSFGILVASWPLQLPPEVPSA